VPYEQNNQDDRNQESFYSKRIQAGKRRTYFFDVRATRGNDYFLTITESRKRVDDNGYDRHKVFIYKEDFNKFVKALGEVVDYVKTELMPDFDFDAFNKNYPESEGQVLNAVGVEEIIGEDITVEEPVNATIAAAPADNGSADVVDKW
jgi:hypothetical protein